MAVCATCHEADLPAGSKHDCPGPHYADIVFTRHRGQGITIDHAPTHTRIALQVLADRYTYLHMPTPDTIVFADQVVYKVTGYADGALDLELVADWRKPVTLTVDRPLSGEEYEDLKRRWQEQHGDGQAAHHVEELRPDHSEEPS